MKRLYRKERNGCTVIFTGPHFCKLIAIRDCPCDDGKTRRVDATGFDTYRVCVKNKSVTGYLVHHPDGYHFHADPNGKHYALLKNPHENTTTQAGR